MTKEAQNVTMWAGDSKTLVFTCTYTALASVVGMTAKWVLKTSVAATTATLTKTTTLGIVLAFVSTGIFTATVTLAPSDTLTLTTGTYYHELEVTDASANVSTVAIGQMVINPTGV